MPTDFLAPYPVVIPATVAWGEMDAFQHVNNIVYFRYFESARMAYFERINFADPNQHGGVGPILAYTQCRYRKALTYPDTLAIGARVSAIQADRFVMELCLVSEKLQRIAAEGTAELVAFDYRNGIKASLPAAVRSSIERLEGWEGRQ
ncbi:acyl-CoA thioesterase [candidate division KSB1 bacterium]|nr:acyl-CoA thioesterase [candidate division KSB1 bacterium]